MCKKLILLTVVLVFGFANVNEAVAIQWTGLGADNLWTNPANWEGNKVPGPTDWVNIESPGATAPNGPLVQEGMYIEIDGMANELPGEPTLTITGGTLVLIGWGIWWGDAGDCVATCYMSGGTMSLTGSPGIHEFGWRRGLMISSGFCRRKAGRFSRCVPPTVTGRPACWWRSACPEEQAFSLPFCSINMLVFLTVEGFAFSRNVPLTVAEQASNSAMKNNHR